MLGSSHNPFFQVDDDFLNLCRIDVVIAVLGLYFFAFFGTLQDSGDEVRYAFPFDLFLFHDSGKNGGII